MHARRCWLALTALTPLAALGCESGGAMEAQREIGELRNQVETLTAELEDRNQAIASLERSLAAAQAAGGLDPALLYSAERIEIDKLTGAEDFDAAPGRDGVTVYLRPLDRDGDIVKTPGAITIELYDLENPDAQQLLGRCEYGPGDLGRLWHGKLWTRHFTLQCPWERPPAHPEVTVRVIFIDTITQRRLTAQTVIRVAQE